jgi:hypothetical protein
MLVAPWQLDLQRSVKIRGRSGWTPVLRGSVVETRRLPALALAGWWGDGCGFGPQGADYSFGVVATAEVALPPGTYRLLVTADDGIRVFVDDRLVIERWTAERAVATEVAVIESSGEPRRIRIDYCQDGGESCLWLRAEPIDR